MIKAILFDVDGTIINSEHIHRQAFNDLLKKYKISISKHQWTSAFVGRGSKYIATYIIQKHHLPEDIDVFVKKRKELFQKLIRKNPVQPVAGFMEFYTFLKKEKFKIAIASSGQRSNILQSLSMIGIASIPIIDIGQVNHRKPHPEIFLKAATKLHVKPSECLVFEDSVVGIQAAKRAKMKVIALRTTMGLSTLKKEKPTLIIQDYTTFLH